MPELTLPDFIIAGASRSGTTTLHGALSKHPDVFTPAKKELQFFFKDSDFSKGPEFYSAYFVDAPSGTLKGEASPPYFEKGIVLGESLELCWSPEDDCPRRIRALLPDTKLIFSLRHPATRACSQYWKHIWQGRETAASLEAVIEDELAGRRKPEEDFMCLLYRNRYRIHLEHWLSLFPREQIQILIFEEWTPSPSSAMAEMERFLGLAPSGMSDSDIETKNQGRKALHPALKPLLRIGNLFPKFVPFSRRFLTKEGYPPIAPETLSRLNALFEDDIAFVESLLGRPVPPWRGEESHP